MITLKKFLNKLTKTGQNEWNPAMTAKDLVQSELECEKAKALGQNNFHQLH